MHTVRPGVSGEIRKLWKMRNTHVGPVMWQETVRNKKREIHTLGLEIWREN